MPLQSLHLNENQPETLGEERRKKLSTFWRRQFQIETTEKQRDFDLIFGIVLPTACFLFDPLVFRGGYSGAVLGEFKPFAYLLSYFSIMALLAFRLWGARLKWFNGFLCGLFAVAAAVSLGIGIVLSPLSLLGLIILIGAVGFTPFFTAFVFARSAVRAYRIAKPVVESKLLFNSIILAAILSLSLPILVNRKIESGLQAMRNGDAQTIRATARRLKMVAPLVDANRLKGADCGNEDSAARDALFETYEELSGRKSRRYDYFFCSGY